MKAKVPEKLGRSLGQYRRYGATIRGWKTYQGFGCYALSIEVTRRDGTRLLNDGDRGFIEVDRGA